MTTPDADALHATLDDVLTRTVVEITGDPDAKPRPGQSALAHDILTAMINATSRDARAGSDHVLGCAPTGVGKAIACAAPAAVMAAKRGHRTVVSTESLALQAQLLTKDLPDIANAILNATGHELTFSVRKGWSNYGCVVQAVTKLRSDLELAGIKDTIPDPADTDPEEVVDAAMTIIQDHPELDTALVNWVLLEAISGGEGDRATCDEDVTEWDKVSIGPTECLGNQDKGCPFAKQCPAVRGREASRESDIVVTNHSLLAVQASQSAPVLLSNPSNGLFRHLIIDEAHALPGQVRGAGARDLSARRITRVARELARNFGTINDLKAPAVDAVVDDGYLVATEVDHLVTAWVRGQVGETPALPPDLSTTSLSPIYDKLLTWGAAVKRALPGGDGLPTSAELSRHRVLGQLGSLLRDVSDLFDPDVAAARWVEAGHVTDSERARGWTGLVMRLSPIDVSEAISGNLFSTTDRKPGEKRPKDEVEPRFPLSVSMVSATLPAGFARESGIRAKAQEYESPFATAYANSMLYVPRVDDPAELARIAARNERGRWRFDVYRHPQWAADYVTELVSANDGYALVLAATAATGKMYADELRRRTRLHVHSQWDGGDPARIAASWKDDPSSVMVGTKSFMTGLDAAGDTCSLVIIDRVPRAPQNVVDDARAQLLMDELDIDKWAADRMVYGADASLTFEQALGRLIRRVSDHGMAVCLDPRLMKNAPLSQPETTRTAYMAAARHFTRRTSSKADALAFLREQAAARAVAGAA